MKSEQRSILLTIFVVVVVVFLVVHHFRRSPCPIQSIRSDLFCFVLITEENLFLLGDVLVETWGHRCGAFRFIVRGPLSPRLSHLPIEVIDDLPLEEYQQLSEKVRRTLIHLSRKYSSHYQWFVKADHDTYLIVENLLRFLLATSKSETRSLLFGYRFGVNGHLSGGSSYVLTREAIRFFAEYLSDPLIYSRCNSSMEDLMVKNCLELLFQLVPDRRTRHLTLIGETIDANGRERFHPLAFRLHFNGPANKSKREWIHSQSFHPNLFGWDSLSETTISFHYTKPEEMYQFDSFLYRIRSLEKEVCLPSPTAEL